MRYLTEVLGAGKLDQLDEIVAKGFVDHTPGASVRHGPEAARQAQQKLRDLFAKVEYQAQALIAEGDQVAARYLVLATPKAPPGAPAPAPLLLNGVALFRVHGARIQEVFVLNDQIGLLRQLGYTLVPPGAGPPASPPPAMPAPPPSSPPPPGRSRPASPVTARPPSDPQPSVPPASGPSPSSPPPSGSAPSSSAPSGSPGPGTTGSAP